MYPLGLSESPGRFESFSNRRKYGQCSRIAHFAHVGTLSRGHTSLRSSHPTSPLQAEPRNDGKRASGSVLSRILSFNTGNVPKRCEGMREEVPVSVKSNAMRFTLAVIELSEYFYCILKAHVKEFSAPLPFIGYLLCPGRTFGEGFF